MPIQGRRFHINSGQETHQNFQSTGSFVAFNPNDGIGLVSLDRTATLLDYDHKLPSQSGGQFPGPINSYLSIYYLDQSGSGAAGEISVYATPKPTDVPHFWSIGRALLSQVTSMDIIEGTQPGNPPAGTLRLWADSNGDMWLLDSSGNTYKVVDTNDALGGILSGTLLNPQFANRVRDNFFSGPQSTRVHFQSSGSNNPTSIGVIPAPGATLAQFILNNNFDPDNAARLRLAADVGGAYIYADQIGSGGYAPIFIYVGGAERLRINTDGTLLINAAAQLQANSSDVQSQNALIAGNGFLFIGSQKDVYFQRASAGNLTLQAVLNSGGPAIIPTAALQANVVTGPLAAYMQTPSWSTTTTGQWVATPMVVNFTPSVANSWMMMEWAVSLRHSVANANCAVALGWSGAAQAMVNQMFLPAANLPITANGTYYYQFPTGTPVSLQVYVSNNTAGTITIDTGMQSRLYATEIKR